MIARIIFSEGNYIKRSQLSLLNDYLGEDVEYDKLKVSEDDAGGYSTLSWRDTFDKDKADLEAEYRLVRESSYILLKKNKDYLVDLEKFMYEFPNITINIKGVPKSLSESGLGMIDELKKIVSKIEQAVNKFDKNVQFNSECNVHVPNLGLLAINKLAYATDYCTEELQELLDRGYRILAVCPQPDQRRPDYILGMYVSALKEDVGVEQFFGNATDLGKKAT